MPKFTVIIGLFLVALGAIAYFAFAAPDERSWTAFIPAFVGIPLVAFGALAMLSGWRKFAMHVVVVFALLGFVAPLGRLIPVSIKNGFVFDVKSGTMIAMSVLCLILLVACIRSFISARKA
jgi:multisubunit Na+/H+ antiporter MnhG subunit